ncbi:uncharacterized protein [Panulirus ornatus]
MFSREKLALTKAAKTSHCYAPIPPQARLSQPKESEPASPSRSSGHRSPESLESSSSQSQSPVPPSPCKSPTGNHAKNVRLRLRDNNSYELISAGGSPMEEQPPDTVTDSFDLSEENDLDEDCEKRDGDEASLEKFQKRQKIIEEQNKMRRELLIQAIADRSRRTQSEAQKLKQIQSELAKLDSLLSTDVSILRDQIEVASQEFNEAQKRYDKAEKDFIEAKLQLFSKLERKELLTEHLCRIIEANERRKACKLSELMAKLEMVDVSPEVPGTGAEDILPQLASLDEVTYAACTTIKDPKKTTLALQMGLAKINGDIPIETVKELLEEEKGKLGNDEEVLENSPDLVIIESNENDSQTHSTEVEQENRTVRLDCENEDAVEGRTVEGKTEENAHLDETHIARVEYEIDASDQVETENLMQSTEIENSQLKEEGVDTDLYGEINRLQKPMIHEATFYHPADHTVKYTLER